MNESKCWHWHFLHLYFARSQKSNNPRKCIATKVLKKQPNSHISRILWFFKLEEHSGDSAVVLIGFLQSWILLRGRHRREWPVRRFPCSFDPLEAKAHLNRTPVEKMSASDGDRSDRNELSEEGNVLYTVYLAVAMAYVFYYLFYVVKVSILRQIKRLISINFYERARKIWFFVDF